jgi:hypothetical protein
MSRKIILLMLLSGIAASGLLYAQTAEKLDDILELPSVSNAQAAWFVLIAADILPEETSSTDAFNYAQSNKLLPARVEAEDQARFGTISLLFMKAFGIRGGLMYALFPTGRYAYRTMTRRGFIQGFADPGLSVSGERFLHILGRVLSYAGGNG